MIELLRHSVPADAKATTVGRYLEGPLGISGTLVRRLKMASGILLNGQVVKTNHPIGAGDELLLQMVPGDAPNVTPEALAITIIYEDADLVLVNKPAGQVVHPTHGVYSGTVANGLAWRWRERGEAASIHPVHRIDRDTSGLVLFARHTLAHQKLAEQLHSDTLSRSYLALARGWLDEENGVIDAPIGLRGDHPTARAVRSDGQTAITTFQVIERYDAADDLPRATLLRLKLATGRTHQIRVHLAYLGHPLLGDDLYGAVRNPLMPRQALHAHTLTLTHPRTGVRETFEAEWPDDLNLLKTIYESGT